MTSESITISLITDHFGDDGTSGGQAMQDVADAWVVVPALLPAVLTRKACKPDGAGLSSRDFGGGSAGKTTPNVLLWRQMIHG